MPDDRFRRGERPRQGRPRPHPRAASRQERGGDQTVIVYGWHPVVEALRNDRRRFRRLLATENSAHRLQDEMGELPIAPEIVRPDAINRLLEPDAVHQGLYLEADPLPSPTVDSLGGDALVVALDQITDPHNVGAIVRSCAAFDVDAILTTARHSPSATGVLAKSASGGLEHVPFVIVRNLAEALIELGERGFQRVAFDSSGEVELGSIPVRRPLAIVLGAEGRGLRQRTRECCDAIGRLEMPGAIKSLNVSNAAALALYALSSRLAR